MSGIRAWVSVADDGPVSPETAMEAVTDALRLFEEPEYPIAVQYGTFKEDLSQVEAFEDSLRKAEEEREDRAPSAAECARARALLFEIAEDGDASAEARCWAAASILGVSFQ